MHERAGAHSARLNCSKQGAVFQSVVTNIGTGFAQSDDLGVGRGIGAADVAVPSASYDPVFVNDYCAYRDFASFERALGAAQGFLHPKLVGMKLGGGCRLVEDCGHAGATGSFAGHWIGVSADILSVEAR